MKIWIKGWRVEGFRCADMEIDCTISGAPASIVLVQMPNGTGKTTTWELLQATLSGAWKGKKYTDVASYLKKTQVEDGEERNPYFQVDIRVETDNDGVFEEWRIKMEVGSEGVQYVTISPEKGGVVPGYRLRGIERFMREEFLRLFMFRGEFANSLFDPRKSQAEEAITILYQLDNFEKIKRWAYDYRDAQRKRQKLSATGVRKLKKLHSRIRLISEQLENQRSKKAEYEHELAELRQNASILKKKLEALQSEERKEQLAKLKEEIEQLVKRKNALLVELATLLRNPIYLHQGFERMIGELYGKFEKLKLPKNATKQFFDELIEAGTCVCGRPIDEEARMRIKEFQNEVLSTEVTGIINSIKATYRMYSEEADEKRNHIKSILEEYLHIENEIYKLNEEVDYINMTSRQEDEKYRQLEEELKNVQRRIQELEQSVAKMEEEEDIRLVAQRDNERIKEIVSIPTLEKLKNMTEREIDELTEVVLIGQGVDLLAKLLDEIKSKALHYAKKEILEDCRKYTAEILWRNPIEIKDIDRAIVLEGQEGASLGQTLAVAYLFIISLLYRAPHKFPLIVDSPAGVLDLQVREELAEIIPTLSHQYIAFTISSERERFVDKLEEKASKEGKRIKFITAFRKTEAISCPKSAKLLGDGVVVEDRTYFYQFDVEEETEA